MHRIKSRKSKFESCDESGGRGSVKGRFSLGIQLGSKRRPIAIRGCRCDQKDRRSINRAYMTRTGKVTYTVRERAGEK